jgi:hypothetical protein
MEYRVALVALSSAVMAACSFQPVDKDASNWNGAGNSSTIAPSADPPDSSWALCQSPECDNTNGTIPLATDFPPIYLPDGGTTTNPCDAIESESLQIREANCAVCHSSPNDQGGWSWVLDDTKLQTLPYGSTGMPLIIAGAPENSLLFQKVSEGVDPTSNAGMPPPMMIPRPSVADVSVLYQWIMCLDADGGPGTIVNYGADGGVDDDAWAADTGVGDSGVGDTGVADTGTVDAGKSDTGVADSGKPPPVNLIINGNFTEGTTDWGIVDGTATISIVGGELCVAVTAANDATTVVLGWPEPEGTAGLPLSGTESYTFSYTAHATREAVTINATVGDTLPPNYSVDFESGTDAVATTATTFVHPFTPASGTDNSAGLSFSFVSKVPQSVCFTTVSLVEN